MTSSKSFSLRILAATAIVMASVIAPVTARAGDNMMIFPLNPFFTDSIRTQHINIVNNSDSAATFRVTLIYQKQRPDGTPELMIKPPNPDLDLAKMLVYSPRQVFLQAGDQQTLKIALRRPKDFPEGENRIYLKLARMNSASGDTIKIPQGHKGMGGRIGMQVGYAVPVIVRHGKNDTTAKMSDFKLKRAGNGQDESLDLVISRKGKFGTIGRVTVYWTAPGQPEKMVSKMTGANIFPELDSRAISVPLKEKSITGGTFRVTYEGSKDGPDEGTVFDEQSFPVSG